MKLFLDSSVILAACGRPQGASRAIFDLHQQAGWQLLASGYVISEVRTNIPRLGPAASQTWAQISGRLIHVEDKLVFDWPVVFAPSKDRPKSYKVEAGIPALNLTANHRLIHRWPKNLSSVI